MDCIFCKILNKEIPATFIYEDGYCVAFPDAHPNSKGHTLVIPKSHHTDFFSTPKDIQEKLLEAANKTAALLKTQYSPTGFNIATNIGKSAGQVIFHTHIHIIPRYETK